MTLYHDHPSEDERIDNLRARTGKPHLFLWAPIREYRGEWLFESSTVSPSKWRLLAGWCQARDDAEGRG